MCSYNQATSLPGFTGLGLCATLVQEEGGTQIVSVFGEVDLSNAHDLDILMLKAVAEAGDGGSVIVDLGGVEFMDLSGLKVLMSGRNILEDSSSGTFAVACQGQVRHLFEITAALTESFELYPDLGSAVAGYPAGGYSVSA